ncbi:MAG: YigZ family protein [Oscillospiraceae bacterium]|nr:YigZ family protein [Oscillospiraceae bacterium]
MDYRTVREFGTDEFIERRSRFIGYATPVETEEEALAFVAEIKEKHRDASHNVSAFVLKNGVKRYSDDGEPKGTAGVPVLEVVEKEGLVNVAVVVTRYFGGTLLGAGGLVRAYSHGAKLGLDAAGLVTMTPCRELSLVLGYELYGKITYLLPQFQVKVLDSDFGAAVRLRLLMQESLFPRFDAQLREMTAATVIPQVERELFAPFEDFSQEI